MIQTTTENYILSPILDHKEKFDLGGTEIIITKDWENNLRSRNCQLGIVESMPNENPLNLSLGDIVFVNHFTFHGDIGANRSFTLNPHIEHDGKLLFRVPPRNIYFKYNDETIEVVGKTVIVESILTDATSVSGLKLEQRQYKDRGRVIYASDDTILGKTVFVDTNALYALELKGLNYFKIIHDEIVGVLEGEELYPSYGRILLQDEEDEFSHSQLDLSMVKKNNTIKSKVIRCGELDKVQRYDEWIKAGDDVLRFRNGGVKYKNQVVVAIADDNIHGVIG